MKTQNLIIGILTASISTALATPPPPPAPSLATLFRAAAVTSLHPDAPGARTDNPADRLNSGAALNAVDQLTAVPTSAGVRSAPLPPKQGPLFSLSGEYNYLNTNDSRFLGSDSQTHSLSIGGTGLFNGDFLVGLNYSYSRTDSAMNILGSYNNADQNFISLIVAKSFMQFLSIGFAGGYGHTDYTIVGPGGRLPANMDTWTVSPFIAASYQTGRLNTSLTAMYHYENDRTTAPGIAAITDDSNKISLTLRASYAATERLRIQGSVKFTEILSGSGQSVGLPVARAWATFGTKVSYSFSKALEVYAGYSYDAFNQFLETHTVNSGLRYSF